MEKDEINLRSKIEVLEAENATLSENAEDTLLLGLAAEIIYHTEDSVLLVDQILERISILKNIPFCACLIQMANGFEVEGIYASFANIQKSEVQIFISSGIIQKPIKDGFLVLDKSEFMPSGFSFQIPGHPFVHPCALIIPYYSKSISNRFFVFLDEGSSENRFAKLQMLLQQIVHLASERIENVFMFRALAELNRDLDQRVTARTEELTEINEELKREIREREIIEAALRINEQKLLSVYNAAIDVAFIAVDLSSKFIIQSFSPGAEKMFGISAIKVLGKPLRLFKLDKHKVIFPDIKNDLDKIGWSRKEEIKLRRNSGEYFTAILTVYPLYDDESNHAGALAVCIDISELKQTQLELIKAREKAEESDRLKTAFLQNMSHEIRTPMNAILGFADLISENFDDREKLNKFTNIIRQRGKDLLEIINDILDIARIESGQILLNPEDCNMGILFTEMETFVVGYQDQLKNKKVRFNLKVAENVRNLDVVIDKLKLKQILINLIGNALKFTRAGKIELGCSIENQNEFEFYISDTGIGIPKEKYTEIFNRFIQVRDDTSRLYGGTGLGLTIVKGLLDLMGGNIWLESEEGKGSTFYFIVPFALKDHRVESHEKGGVTEKYFAHRDVKILVVDDKFNVIYIKEMLSDTEFDVVEARNGKKALEICTLQHIDLVVIDLHHIEMPCYQLIGLIREQNPDIRIIVQAAHATSEDEKKARGFGCDDYLGKPVKQELLLSRIKHHLNSQNNHVNS